MSQRLGGRRFGGNKVLPRENVCPLKKVVRSGFCLNLFPTHVLNLISGLLPWHLTMGLAAATPFLYRSYSAD